MKTSGNIAIYDVWKDKTPELLQEIVDTWDQAKALPKSVDPIKRANEVVLIVRTDSHQIIGVTTAVKTYYPQLKNDLFFIRGFILPEFRIPGLFAKMITQTLAKLEASFLQSKDEKRPIGAIAEIENARLKQANVTKLVSGMTLLGFSQKDNPIYVYYFRGSRY